MKMYLYAGIIIAVFFAGWTSRGWREDSKDLAATQKAVAEAVATAKEEARIHEKSAVAHAVKSARMRVVNRKITKEVAEYVSNNPIADRVCLDDRGIMLWNAASSGKIPEPKTTSGNDATVPRRTP